MRTLFLIRHAKSSWESPGLRDFDRPLNERGLRDAPEMAKYMVNRGFRPDLMASSPAKRALTTGQIFAKAFDIPDTSVLRLPSIYEAFPLEILRAISNFPDSAQTIYLFGHNPGFTEVANHFTEDFIDNVPTCGIVHIASTADTWSEFSDLNAKVVGCYFPKEIN